MTTQKPTNERLASPWTFFLFVLTWTWFFWILDIVLGWSVNSPAGAALGLLGLVGPMVWGIAFTYLTRDAAGRRDYWRRVIDLKRIPGRWYIVIFLLVPGLMGLAALLDILTGGTVSAFQKTLAPFASQPAALIPFAASVLLIGPLPEELGWRGYVLDRLQSRWSALMSGLVLGAVWAVWHLPLFFIRDTYQNVQGAWSPWFWTFFVGILPLSVVFTWIFNNTGRSTLAIILFHFMVVFTDDFLNATVATNLYSTILWILAAVAVTVYAGPKTLARKPSEP